MLGELLLQLGCSVEGFPALLLRQALVHLPEDHRDFTVLSAAVFQASGRSTEPKNCYRSDTNEEANGPPGFYCEDGVCNSHDVLHRFGFDEDGDGVKLSQLESLDGVPRHVQDTVFTLKTTEEEEEQQHVPSNQTFITYFHLKCRVTSGTVPTAKPKPATDTN